MIKELMAGVVSFIAFTMHAITGFGGNILVFPVLTALYGTVVARISLNLIAWVSSISVTADSYHDINFKELKKIIIWMGSGLVIGKLIIPYIKSETLLMLIYGIIIIIVAVYKLTVKQQTDFPRAVLAVILILAGIVQALFVSGGAFLVIYCTQALKDKKEFRATFSVVWLSIYTVMFFVQLVEGAYNATVLRVALFGAIPVVIASWIGSKITSRINQKTFMLIVYIFILFVGISLTVTNFNKILLA